MNLWSLNPFETVPDRLCSTMFRLFSPLIACLIFPLAYSLVDFTLSCQRGYKVSAIHRSNSIHQNGRAGSLGIECQSIVDTDLDSVSFRMSVSVCI